MYYNECPLCGANLDPGEPCDCQEEKKSKKKLQLKNQSEHRNRALQLGLAGIFFFTDFDGVFAVIPSGLRIAFVDDGPNIIMGLSATWLDMESALTFMRIRRSRIFRRSEEEFV